MIDLIGNLFLRQEPTSKTLVEGSFGLLRNAGNFTCDTGDIWLSDAPVLLDRGVGSVVRARQHGDER